MTQPQTQQGYLVLADISGFVLFVETTEIDHAQAILHELLELIVQRLSPTLTVGAVDGDGVFVYAPQSKLSRGETLLELFESTYDAFRREQTSMQRNITCTCRACQSVSSLDLKFIAHYGSYLIQQLAGRNDLLGLDVQLIRERWLKNQMDGDNKPRGYALFTQACLTQMSISPASMSSQSASYDHFGAVQTHTLNLHEHYNQLLATSQVFITAQEADCVVSYEFTMPPPVVWEWFNDPGKRTKWMHGFTWTARARPQGRTEVGAVNHCSHKTGQSTETIVAWRPFEVVTAEVRQPPVPLTIIESFQFEALDNGKGTRLHGHLKIKEPIPRWVARRICEYTLFKVGNIIQEWDRMAELMQAAADVVR